MTANARGNQCRQNFRRLTFRWWPTVISSGCACACACIITGSWWWLAAAGAVNAVAFWVWRRHHRNLVLGMLRELGRRDEEKKTRAQLGVPASHPESITAELPAADEAWLAETCSALWPEGEYTREIQMFGGAE